jgi:thymidylate kinase
VLDQPLGLHAYLTPARGRFLVLLGIDGSGKSTLLFCMAKAGVQTASWHELRSHEVPATLAPNVPTSVKNRLTPLARAMFIGGHLVAQYEYLVRPRIEAGLTTVLDSYYYKLLAKERLLGFAHPALEQLCAELPQPDGIIYVDVDPRESYRRKKGCFSSYEHFGAPSQDSYVAFQTQLAMSLHSSASAAAAHVVIDGSYPPEMLLREALHSVTTLTNEELAS